MIWHSSQANEVLKHFNVDDKKGMLNSECEEKLEIYGQNVISKLEKPTLFRRFLNQLYNKMVITLIVIALISFIVSLVYNELNSLSGLLIIAIVVLNALISAYHIHNCDNTMDNIKTITNPSVTVLRDGVTKTINAANLVTGDIIILEEGDYIPADARIIESNEFRCNEANLTGATVPVEKNADLVLDDITLLENRSNMVFYGTSVAHGNAKAVVTATGLNTEMGKTSAILQQTGEDKMPLQNSLNVIGKIANIVILIICGFVLLISLIQNFAAENFASMTIQMLVNSVALAVAAIPEGLPTISAIVIALGIKRILNDNIIVKDISAVEILGKTDVLCCDKTGVLTRNKMVVNKIFDGDKLCDLNADKPDEKILTVIKLATACSTLTNDSTEDAIQKACLIYNSMSTEDIDNVFPKVATIPFDSERKSMSVITMINKTPVAIVKGAPEQVLPNCINCNSEEILKINTELASEGHRIVCIAIRELVELPANPTAEEIENNLIFVGLVALDDPPREGVIEDIAACQSAGITTIMMTGDNLITAKTVAARIGILRDGTEAITGAELCEMTDEELIENIEKYSVYARITPKDKLRIVKAWQANGKTVTITGDNLEDADSLAIANVGCAIGKYGADVTKGNADIIISNNRFHSVLKAIRESRGLFSNIKKSIYYLFSCNIAEVVLVLFGWLIFKNAPITAVQLLLINLLTDSAPAISLSLEKAEKSVMNHKSSVVSKIFNLKSTLLITMQSIFIVLLTLVAYFLGNDFGDKTAASTFAFAVLGITQMFHCFNSKFEFAISLKKFFNNSFMNISVLVSLFVIIFLILTPAGVVFGLEALTLTQFLLCLVMSLLIIPFNEIVKSLINIIFKEKA
ncbi:MAG: cation-translocating P-type ATPase [Clostridia bacterium]|nr:cation-translocating P-type ATPase [Clostridia bacterium]